MQKFLLCVLCFAGVQTWAQQPGTYEFNSDVDLTAGESLYNLHFEKGEQVELLAGPNHQLWLELHLADAEIGTVPALIAVDSDFVTASLHALRTDLVHAFRRGVTRGRLHYMGATGCVAYVLRAIGWRGGRSGNGWEVTRTLRGHGYHEVSCGNPPYGAVASWAGGHSGAGHTAIWNGACWAYDIACADPGRLYRLIDCVAR